MKLKLGKLPAVKNVGYSNYKMLLKKTLQELLQDSAAKGISEYVLVQGERLTWKDATEEADKPLLYLGDRKAWVKALKANKEFELKDYSYGSCKAVLVGSDVHLALCPEKGKLTQDAFLKPLKKVFKTYKPKVFVEVVESLDLVQEGTGGENLTNGENQPQQLLEQLGTQLKQYHLDFQQNKTDIAAAKDNKTKQAALVKRNKIAKRLKHLCANWQTSIAPEAATLIETAQQKEWEKIYQHWQAFFVKRQAAKEGTATDTAALLAEEERIYSKTLGDLQQFYANIDKGEIAPSVIESNLANFEGHLTKWKAFVQGKPAGLADELAALEKQLAQAKSDWTTMKPLITRYHETSTRLEQAAEGEDYENIAELYDQLDRIREEIQSA
jgi:hypothetical protein